MKCHWVWFDGASSQFKARRPFYIVARYYQITGLQMMHNFSASDHGKGEHAGVGAVIKRTLTHEQLKPDGWPMKCAANVVNFLNATFVHKDQAHRCNTLRVFLASFRGGCGVHSKPSISTAGGIGMLASNLFLIIL